MRFQLGFDTSNDWLILSKNYCHEAHSPFEFTVCYCIELNSMESANTDHSPSRDRFTVEIELDRVARWDIYFHLRELSVPCECKFNQPLQVQVNTASTAMQVWSLVQVFTSPKQQCIERLERCWRQKGSVRDWL